MTTSRFILFSASRSSELSYATEYSTDKIRISTSPLEETFAAGVSRRTEIYIFVFMHGFTPGLHLTTGYTILQFARAFTHLTALSLAGDEGRRSSIRVPAVI